MPILQPTRSSSPIRKSQGGTPESNPTPRSAVLISVVIVDDDDSFRGKIESWLRTNPRFQCAGSYSDGKTGLAQICSKPPALAVLELGQACVKAQAMIQRIKRRAPSTRVALLTGTADTQAVFCALDAGADGFLDKDALTRREFFTQLDLLLAGGHPLSERVCHIFAQEYVKNRPNPEIIVRLTSREREVAVRQCRGFPSEAIARELGISVWTVRTHQREIHRKLQVHNRADLQLKILGMASRSDD